MEFKSQICTTREQSNVLIDLGLDAVTADCKWVGCVKNNRGETVKYPCWRLCTATDEPIVALGFAEWKEIPAWSLHRLLELLPNQSLPACFTRIKNGMPAYESLLEEIIGLITKGSFNKAYLSDNGKAAEQALMKKDVPVGETVVINGVEYVCIQDDSENCDGCAFLCDDDCQSPLWLLCWGNSRKDKSDVCFLRK